jgi:hypothetical protein
MYTAQHKNYEFGRSWRIGLAGVIILAAAAVGLADAKAGDTVSYDSGDTEFDLSSAGETPNAGAHLSLGEGILLTPGTWTIDAAATLFVPEVGRETKNSQGCGLWAGGYGQIGGAGGSSSGWTEIEGGKEKTLNLITHPWSSDPEYDPVITFTVPAEDEVAWIELVCFIDQSHSGATFEDRIGMAAYDVSIVATPVVESNHGQEVSTGSRRPTSRLRSRQPRA